MQRVEWTLPPDVRALIWANPNGGKRDARTGARLKAEGVKAGVPDITVAIARGAYKGLYLEMKRTKAGRVSQEQRDMLANLNAAGYLALAVRGCESAWAALTDYLE